MLQIYAMCPTSYILLILSSIHYVAVLYPKPLPLCREELPVFPLQRFAFEFFPVLPRSSNTNACGAHGTCMKGLHALLRPPFQNNTEIPCVFINILHHL